MTQLKSVYTTMLAWQTLATCIAGLVIFFISGKNAAISACLGGFSIILGAAFASIIFVRNSRKQDAATILVGLLTSEMVKLVFVFCFLFLVVRHYKSLVPVALIIGLMAAALMSGVAMSKIVSKSS